MRAAPLLDLRVTHPFYADLRCGDLVIAPTAATEALMRRLAVTCKTFPDHASLYAGLDPTGTAVAAAAAPIALEFELRSRGPGFALITDLAALDAQVAPVFTNQGVAAANPLNLRLTTRTAQGSETLVASAPSASEAFVLAGKPLPGTAVGDFKVAGAGKVAAVSLALDKGLLSPAASPQAFVVPFAAAAARWAYYVVMDFAGDISTLRIVDATPGNGPRAVTFGDAGRVDLAQTPDPGDAVGVDLLRRNPGRRVIRLLSDAAVPAREVPLRQLELRLADTRLLGALANPRPDRLVSLRTAPPPAPAATVLYDVLFLLTN